jgi:hypothetical protein
LRQEKSSKTAGGCGGGATVEMIRRTVDMDAAIMNNIK